ncbi:MULTISPECIES: hypothetical protein [Paenibacillus]|uniref:Uncharacterized protein n=1 Tax=Paenibacillus lignilyticus TaxID=1172615 RepID=A0ABS5CN41_9BACL|nr:MULTISPECIES: hypothetical protein [Paenibacillus]MBP3967237.1 hypothetical protein [Paenibacillus lignilyticus]
MTTISKEVQSLVNQLHLSDNEIAEKFQFTQFGQQLTLEESKRFIAFLKQELVVAST